MTTLKAVIGASNGDEGKGHMTDYFVSNTMGSCLVVCTNGGAQRGHTVVTDKDGQHIFHHYGSGTFAYADTYLPAQYVVNPMIFMQEYMELQSYNPRIFINPNALCSTPFDMIVNQIIEEKRGKHKHGSCGVGIWETVLRNEATVGELFSMHPEQLYTYLVGVRDTYFENRLKRKGISVPKRWQNIYFSEELLHHYIRDVQEMYKIVDMAVDKVISTYDNVIFENGQGLLLDQNMPNSQYSTPSNTGSANIYKMVSDVFGTEYNIDICYVTRIYDTRHGEGPMFDEIGSNLIDLKTYTETNVWNKNQGVFRYGMHDVDSLFNRINNDFDTHWCDKNATKSIAITHMDEKFRTSTHTNSVDRLVSKSYKFDKHYESYGPNRSSIKCVWQEVVTNEG